LYLSTLGAFAVPGASGGPADVFAFTPTSNGANTAGTFGPGLTLDGSRYGLAGLNIDGISLGLPPASASSTGGLFTGESGGGSSVGDPPMLMPDFPPIPPALLGEVFAPPPPLAPNPAPPPPPAATVQLKRELVSVLGAGLSKVKRRRR